VPTSEAALDALMSRLARGDRSAFDPLYAELRPRALRLAEARVGAASAADVAQSALLKVFARASEFSLGRPCLPWFYAIVANEIRAQQRTNARLTLSDHAGAELADHTENAEAQLLRRELERALAQAVAELDGDAATALRAVLGLEPKPALSAATFRKRVSRAYAKLRLIFGAEHVG